MDKPKLSFVTTCMGRLEHLKQTLPTQQHPDCESIVVDWSCPDGTADWVRENHPWVKVVEVKGEKFYHRSKARNAGVDVAQGNYICNADADMYIRWRLFDLLDALKPDEYVVRIPTHVFVDRKIGSSSLSRMNGERTEEPTITWKTPRGDVQKERASHTGFTIFPNRFKYDNIFNETMSGGEDLDIRMQMLIDGGLAERTIGGKYIDTISHTDESRAAFLSTDDFSKAFQIQVKALTTKWGNGRTWSPALVERLKEMYK